MQIVSYNINGIKSAFANGLNEFLEEHDFDIVCLQEVKSDDFDLPQNIKTKYPYVYHKFSKKKGHHGVSVLSKIKADQVLAWNSDDEGRLIILRFDDWYLFNVYAPSTSDSRNFDKKLAFLDKLIRVTSHYSKILMLGDFNIAPTDSDMFETKTPRLPAGGHFPEERERYFKITETFEDVFLQFHTQMKYTFYKFPVWREENRGWRIDFIFAKNMKYSKCDVISQSKISDHDPIFVELIM